MWLRPKQLYSQGQMPNRINAHMHSACKSFPNQRDFYIAWTSRVRRTIMSLLQSLYLFRKPTLFLKHAYKENVYI